MAVDPDYTQCLLFIVRETSGSGTKKLRNSFKRSKTAADAVPSDLKAFVLFPQVFKNKRPEVLNLFKQNDLHVCSQNMSSLRLGNVQELEVIEFVLEESPSASLNPLFLITDNANREVLRLFLRNTTVCGGYEDGLDCVRPAIDSKNFAIIKRLFARKVKILCRHRLKESLLHLAAKRGPENLVSLVLEHEENVDVRSSDGTTPLHLAIENGCDSVVQLLLERGADAQVPKNDGTFPLHLAALNGHCQIAQLLLEHGADVQVEMQGSTPLHLAAVNDFSPMVKFLLSRGAVVDCKDSFGETALSVAASEAHLGTSVELLLSGADVNMKSDLGQTPIFFAVRKGHIQLVEFLVKFGAEINVKDKFNSTALKQAYVGKQPNIFQYLLDSYYLDSRFLVESHIVQKFLNTFNQINQDLLSNLRHQLDEFSLFSKILAHHIIKITALNLHNIVDEIDVSKLWNDSVDEIDASSLGTDSLPTTFREFKARCEKEVVCMRSETVGDTDLSFYDILTKDVHEVACFLKNIFVAQHVALDELRKKFPVYANILMLHFRKGRERKEMLEEGLKICNFLFSHFKKLPYEIKERILSYLSFKDFFILKVACGRRIVPL